MRIFRDTHFAFMKRRRLWLAISLTVLIGAWAAELVRGGLNLGIDFVGGTQLTLKLRQEPELDRLRQALADAGIAQAQIQRFGESGDNEVLIKTPILEGSEEGSQARITAAVDALFDQGQGFDLNRRGTEALTSLLVRLDPDGRGTGVQAADHYGDVAAAIAGVKTEQGLIGSWEELGGVQGVSPAVVQALRGAATLGDYAVLGVESVGPQVGAELRRKGILAIVFSLLGMLAYIWLRFELRFGIGALVAVVHDVLIVLALFALTRYEFNLTTVAAFLTLVGYSVNDSVVLFDRVRENMRRTRRQSFEEVLDVSINQTLSRTALTSGTTLLATGCLLFFGGDVLRGFAFILSIGIIFGTFSSIYIASPFALWWERAFGKGARSERKERRAAL